MKTQRVLRGFSVLAIVLASLVMGVPGVVLAACQVINSTGSVSPSGQASLGDCLNVNASAFSEMTGTYLPGMAGGDSLAAEPSVSAVAPSISCLTTLRQDLETVLPSGWSEAQACSVLQTKGLALQSKPALTTDKAASVFCLGTLHQDLGTVLPSGLTNAQACSTLQYVEAAQQSGIIPATGGQADPPDPIACWRDAGASSCR